MSRKHNVGFTYQMLLSMIFEVENFWTLREIHTSVSAFFICIPHDSPRKLTCLNLRKYTHTKVSVCGAMLIFQSCFCLCQKCFEQKHQQAFQWFSFETLKQGKELGVSAASWFYSLSLNAPQVAGICSSVSLNPFWQQKGSSSAGDSSVTTVFM